MKYTEKSLDFQRVLRRVRSAAIGLLLVGPVAGAQEIAWPEPAATPERFVGAFVSREGYEHFYDPFQSLTLYGVDRRASGTILGKCSFGERGSFSGTQAELEWYPVLATGSYAYVGYAVGFDAPFPRHRGGIEYFSVLPGNYEASAGVRGFVFHDRRTVMLVTGSAAKYFGNFWIAIRPYISANLPQVSVSLIATGRYYVGDRDEYVFVRAGAGFTPDERSTFTMSGLPATEVFTLRSQMIGGGGQWYAWPGWLVSAEAMLGRLEVGFRRGTYVWNPSFVLGARYSLR